MARVLGYCQRCFTDDKTGERITGYAFRLAVDWSTSDGVGYDADKLFVRNDSAEGMQKVVQFKSFCENQTEVKVSYNRFGKITDLEEI